LTGGHKVTDSPLRQGSIGKSTTIPNLAAPLAEAGNKCMIIAAITGGFYAANSLNRKVQGTVMDMARERGTVESLEPEEVLLHGFRRSSVLGWARIAMAAV
jgi:nitrogenase iron protein NifH